MGRVCLLVCCTVWVLAAASSSLRADRGAEGSQTPSAAPAAKPASAPSLQAAEQGLIKQYCVTCHNARALTGGLSLEGLDPAAAAATPTSGKKWR